MKHNIEDNFGSISIYIDNKKNNTSKAINIPSRKPSIWIPNEKITNCFKCRSEFSLLNRKHHCRSCGRIFCRNCSCWYSKKNDYITSATPPNDTYNYLNELFYSENKIKTCEECYKESQSVEYYKNELIVLLHLPITISNLLYLRTISKKWCKTINYLIRIYRSIQYKLPSQKINKIERDLLWNHRYEFKNHYFLITKCLIYNNYKSKKKIKKYIDFLLKENDKNNENNYNCKNILCKSNCNMTCKPENILEIAFYVDLSKHLCVEKYIVDLLNHKTKGYYNLLMPWLIELSKKFLELGLDLAFKCINDIELYYSFYFETKYYLNTLDKTQNKNLKYMMNRINLHSTDEYKNDIRKTDEFIKFLKLLIQKKPHEMEDLINHWFNTNGYIRMPWNPNTICMGIDFKNIKQLNSSTRPFIVPLIIKKHTCSTNGICEILIKNEDLRKDKLTMYVAKWLKNICKDDVSICTYNVLPYELNYGWIEIIKNSVTLYDISNKYNTTLQNYIMDLNKNLTIEQLRYNFIKSCVSSCVLCYILGVGDRHAENILVNRYGDLVHIDFSYLLGEDPKNIPVEMKITPDMLMMLGGKNSNQFKMFKKKCEIVYKKVRSRSSLWYLLLVFLAFTKPEIYPYHNDFDFIKRYVINRLVPGEFDDESSIQISEIVDRSSERNWGEFISDYSHHLSNKIKKYL